LACRGPSPSLGFFLAGRFLFFESMAGPWFAGGSL